MERKIEQWPELTHDQPLRGWWGIRTKQDVPLRAYVHFALEFHLLLKGSFKIHNRAGWRTLKPGDVSFNGPWEPHYRHVLEDGTETLTLIFLPVFLYGSNLPVANLLLPFLSLKVRKAVQKYDDTMRERVLARAAFIRDALEEKSAFGNRMARLDTQRLLLELTRNVDRIPGVRKDSGTFHGFDKVFKVFDFISSNMGNKISITDAASHVGLGRSNFARIFKEITGTPFADFVLNAKLEAARERVVSTNDKIAAIAYDLGFSDASHLTRHFKKKYGRTPGQFPRGEQSA